jgi:hypothetical protein
MNLICAFVDVDDCRAKGAPYAESRGHARLVGEVENSIAPCANGVETSHSRDSELKREMSDSVETRGLVLFHKVLPTKTHQIGVRLRGRDIGGFRYILQLERPCGVGKGV